MFERFTARARHTVVLAQEEARRLEHNYIGTEHLLLGLFGEPESIGARALAQFGMTLAQTREDVLARIGKGTTRVEGHIPFTPRAKKVLEFSLREALQLGHNYIGTEHIVLGLLREGDGVGAQILNARIPEPAQTRLRMAVIDLLPVAPPGGSRRRWLRRSRSMTGQQETDVQLDTTPAADSALSEAVKLAAGAPVGSQHLMLAALADPDNAAARALAALGVDLEQAREALRRADTVATSDEAPEDLGRRMMRIRVTDQQVVIEASDERIVQLAHSVIVALGDDVDEPNSIAGEHALATSFTNLWRAMQDTFDDILRRIAVKSSLPESST